MLRIIEEARPRWVLGENVTGIDSMELDNILSDLDRCGYKAQRAFEIPACALDSPQWRNRIWFVAYTANGGLSERRIKRKERTGCKGHQGPDYASENPGSAWPEIATKLCRMDKRIPNRMDRIRVLGNSVMPGIVYMFLNCIKIIEEAAP
jgi:DNA (cytosine-5)-methyltransferase 1